MKFSELESLMQNQGVGTLAELARILDTTPQAVSNWKSRDQVPYHIVTKVHSLSNKQSNNFYQAGLNPTNTYEEESATLSDLMVRLSEQIKLILLIPFITVFITFTYVQFIQVPKYVSSARILLPENSGGRMGSLAGLASQFGISVGSGSAEDLSSPTLFPDLLKSRVFAENLLNKEFYTEKYGKKLSLLAILKYGDGTPPYGKDTLITQTLGLLEEIIAFEQDPQSKFSLIIANTFEPILAKEIVEATLVELELLNRFYKTQAVNEKTTFIEQRIAAVKGDLENSEQSLKTFQENNRQISSPSLQLSFERLQREVEIQKGIYLTLKQQLELAKIEEVQEASIVQVLDRPQAPLGLSNKKLKRSVLLAGFLGLGLGALLGFARSSLNSSDIDERKKIRRIRSFLLKKGKGMINDRRVIGIIGTVFICGLPYYLGHQSKIPVFFGMYSTKLMVINVVYISILITCIAMFINLSRKRK